ncbi:MAG: 50S ribosomal protein L9, partial [Clostridiales bacterium]|nr:50S ribosomal protein L9 [Clostridiales bacterium]
QIAKDFDIQVDKRKITVEEIKQYGTFSVEVKVYQGISANLYVLVGE